MDTFESAVFSWYIALFGEGLANELQSELGRIPTKLGFCGQFQWQMIYLGDSIVESFSFHFAAAPENFWDAKAIGWCPRIPVNVV